MINLVINGRFLHRPVTGVERYAHGLLAALDRHLERQGDEAEFDVEVLTPRGELAPPGWRRLRLRAVGRIRGHLWEQLELPLALAGRALVNPCNLAPLAVTRQLTIIHDLAVFSVPEAFTPVFRHYYRTLLPLLAHRSQEVATVSEFSRGELARHLGMAPERPTVAPPGVEALERVAPDRAALARLDLVPGTYALAVGSRDPRKNLAALIHVASRLSDIPFVLVGGANAAVFSARGPALPENVRALGYVPDPVLRALYEGARLFVFPSLYEGFGIPPVEAMQAGCPVLVSDVASLPETCGEAALYCNPHDPDSITDVVGKLWVDETLRSELSRRGLEHAANFTWDACLERLLPALRRLTT